MFLMDRNVSDTLAVAAFPQRSVGLFYSSAAVNLTWAERVILTECVPALKWE